MLTMNGLLIYSAKYDSVGNERRIQIFSDAFQKWQLKVIAVSTDEFHRVLETSKPGFFTFAFLLDEDTQIAKFLEEEHHLKVFNDETAINVSLDRALFAISLRNASIPSPTTVTLPYTINESVMNEFVEVKAMMEEIQYPVLIKNRHPQKDEKIYFINNDLELENLLKNIGMQPLIAQAYIPPTERQQFKVLVVGKKALASVEIVRVDHQEYLKQTQVPSKVANVAIKAAQAMGASYALISIFYLNKKNPYVYSAKTNPNIVELQVVTGLYLAWYIAKLVYQRLKKS
jgi:glutathione synthase/RimK-type ligase-like ATP-grasp enzyme